MDRAEAASRGPKGIAGWLLLFCVLLLVWQPLSLGLVASSVLDALPIRGLPLALVLLLRVAIVSLGIAAGLTLLSRRPAAVPLAKASLLASAATDVFVYTTPYFPNNRPPGDTTIVVIVSLAYYALWFGYLLRSRRVKNTFA